MAVSSIKGCWYKFSARIRDALDVVDSYYRPADETDGQQQQQHHHHHHQQQQSRRIGRDSGPVLEGDILHNVKDKRNGKHSSHRHHHHHHNCGAGAEATSANAKHQMSPRSRLPPGFTKRKTSQGQVFFIDSNGHQYWYDPSVPKELLGASLNLDLLVGRLSSTWEVRQTSSGKTYYVNHIKKTTQFTDPRLVAYKDHLMSILKRTQLANTVQNNTTANYATTTTTNTATATTASATNTNTNTNTNTTPTTTIKRHQQSSQGVVGGGGIGGQHLGQQNCMNNKELADKISILRQELLKQQVIAHPCRIDVNRKRIFEESFRVITLMQPRDLKKRLLVKFRGEEGLDYGGVAREWFYLLSREMLNPAHGLFQYTSDDIYNLQINPDSHGIVFREQEHLAYMKFCGRIIGMAVFHGHFIEGHFTLPFYKMLLKKPINLGDIEFVDPELHRSLCWILDNDITNVIDTTFLVQHNAFGQLQEHELKENGRNTVVTEANKHEYVSLYVNYRCRRGIEVQFEALQRGFYELISASLLENFDERELELLVGGLSKINIEDWRLHTRLKNCTVETPLVKWFWDIVKSYSEDKRARLLQFVTGSPRVPIQGFKALQGVNSELRMFTIHLIKNACTDNLPKSHTCFNRIDLPPYENYEKLRDKLTQAIEETMGFTMQ